MKKIKSCTVIPGAITSEDIPKINDILKNISMDPNSLIFQHPVDYEAEGLLDYPTVVKYPMDLSTVRNKLVNSIYTSAQEVIDDIMLIWKNCKIYNIEDSDIYRCAEYMEKLAKKNIEKYYKVKFLKQNKFTLTKNYQDEDFLPPVTKDNEMSLEEKLILSDKIKKQSNEGLSLVVAYLKDNCTSAFINVDKDRYRIIIDSINKKVHNEILEILSALDKKKLEKRALAKKSSNNKDTKINEHINMLNNNNNNKSDNNNSSIYNSDDKSSKVESDTSIISDNYNKLSCNENINSKLNIKENNLNSIIQKNDTSKKPIEI